MVKGPPDRIQQGGGRGGRGRGIPSWGGFLVEKNADGRVLRSARSAGGLTRTDVGVCGSVGLVRGLGPLSVERAYGPVRRPFCGAVGTLVATRPPTEGRSPRTPALPLPCLRARYPDNVTTNFSDTNRRGFGTAAAPEGTAPAGAFLGEVQWKGGGRGEYWSEGVGGGGSSWVRLEKGKGLGVLLVVCPFGAVRPIPRAPHTFPSRPTWP